MDKLTYYYAILSIPRIKQASVEFKREAIKDGVRRDRIFRLNMGYYNYRVIRLIDSREIDNSTYPDDEFKQARIESLKTDTRIVKTWLLVYSPIESWIDVRL